MISVVIIDDEKKARSALRQIVETNCKNIHISAEADGVESGLQAITEFKPDVLLLDIKMKDGSGFDLIKKLADLNCKIIFVTAYNEFAIKAFKFSAIDYLLKPVDPDDLTEALKKAEADITKEKNNKYLGSLLENFAGAAKQLKKLALKTATNIYIFNVSDITYCKSDGNYTEFFCIDGKKALVSKPMGEYEELLNEYGFIRIHNSYLVNISHCVRFDKTDDVLILNSGENIPVSARKRELLVEAINRL